MARRRNCPCCGEDGSVVWLTMHPEDNSPTGWCSYCGATEQEMSSTVRKQLETPRKQR